MLVSEPMLHQECLYWYALL